MLSSPVRGGRTLDDLSEIKNRNQKILEIVTAVSYAGSLSEFLVPTQKDVASESEIVEFS